MNKLKRKNIIIIIRDKKDQTEDTMIYSDSLTKHLFALLHSPSHLLESFYYVNKLPYGRENLTSSLHLLTILS